MESINIIRGITKFTAFAAGIIYSFFVIAVLFYRAAALEAVTDEEIALFVIFGLVIGTLFCIDFVVKSIRSEMKRQRSRSMAY